MEAHSLDRASRYLNNLLLSRGLLSSGKPIDFARPDSNGRGTDATMSRIINLVHDLVLRRDQDAEQRETLAMTIRVARADESQRVLDLQRLEDKNTELARLAASSESQERALRMAARKAEAQAKELKEQMLRMKSTLDQVRAKCLSDVRKRDAELDKMKAHLAGLQRGRKEASGMKINVINWEPEVRAKEKRMGRDVNSTEWSLEKETNDFLAAVLNETSTENVSLRRIITDTMGLLSDLTGLSQSGDNQDDHQDGHWSKSPSQHPRPMRETSLPAQELTSSETLADQMNIILGHCQSILKDPSFVPIEEVQLRDEEIMKLRAGWEKMATKWREAVAMMDDWRRRGAKHGQSLLNNDYSAVDFGKSAAIFPIGQPEFGADEGLPSDLYEDTNVADKTAQHSATKKKRDLSQPEVLDEEYHQESDLDIPPEPRAKRRVSSLRRAGSNIGKPIRPLQAIDQNLNASPKRTSGTMYLSKGPANARAASSDCQQETENNISQQETEGHLPEHFESKETFHEEQNYQEQAGRKQSDTLTVSEKLAAVEAEANEARNLSPQRTKKRKQVGTNRTKRAPRRRSTLSPDELAALMGVE